MDDDDLLDRVRGKGLPGSRPLGPPKQPEHQVADPKEQWRTDPLNPQFEINGETPPRRRTRNYSPG